MEISNTPDTMTCSSQILEKLRENHFDNEFRWTPAGFTSRNGKTYQPEDLMIMKTFRFEGESDPADMEIIYIIRANDGFIGYSQNAYGVYSSHQEEEGYDNFIRRTREAGHEEQMTFEL